MSISRFFSVGAVGASLLVLAACGSPAKEPVTTTPEEQAFQDRTPTTSATPRDETALGRATTDGSPSVIVAEGSTGSDLPPPQIDYYTSFRSFGFSNSAGKVGLSTSTGDNLFVQLTGIKLLSAPGKSGHAGFLDEDDADAVVVPYLPFYLGWTFDGAANNSPASPLFFAPGVGRLGDRYGVKDGDGRNLQADDYLSPWAYLNGDNAGNPSTNTAAITASSGGDRAPNANFETSPSGKGEVGTVLSGRFLQAKLTGGTSTIDWADPGDANTGDASILRYNVELIYPKLRTNVWSLQYSTFILSRARRTLPDTR